MIFLSMLARACSFFTLIHEHMFAPLARAPYTYTNKRIKIHWKNLLTSSIVSDIIDISKGKENIKMEYWLLKDYGSGDCALFTSRHRAETFVKKLNYALFMETGEESDADYAIIKLELNPDFEKWFYQNEDN